MNPTDPNRELQQPDDDSQRNEEQTMTADRPTRMDRSLGQEEPPDSVDRDADLQKEGNLGNERNRNEPDTEQRPGGSRENLES